MNFNEWLQSRLTAHGFPSGGIDGVIGLNTIKALKAFEASHGLPMNGTADERVVELLRLSASDISTLERKSIPDRDDDEGARPPAHPVRNIWPRQADVMSFYGSVGENQTHIEVPYDMVLAWAPDTRIRRMTLHQKVAPSAERVMNRIVEIYSPAERRALGLHLFGGSLNVRRMRGGSRYSMHSWGIAIDFDPQRNALMAHRPEARLSHGDARPFWEAWADEGWLSLGRTRDFDWMHVQAARL